MPTSLLDLDSETFSSQVGTSLVILKFFSYTIYVPLEIPGTIVSLVSAFLKWDT